MKIKLMRVLPALLMLTGVVAIPITTIACSSTQTPERPNISSTHVYQPSTAIAAKFSKADFDAYCRGFELEAVAETTEKVSVSLKDNQLTRIYFDNSQAGKISLIEHVLVLAKQAQSQLWKDGKIDPTQTKSLTIADLMRTTEAYHSQGLTDLQYKPSSQIAEKFSKVDFYTLQAGWEMYRVEPYLYKQTLLLDGDKITLPLTSTDENLEASITIGLVAPYTVVVSSDKPTTQDVTLDEIKQMLQPMYDLGVKFNKNENVYKPNENTPELFSKAYWEKFSRGWMKLSSTMTEAKKYPAMLEGDAITLTKLIVVEGNHKPVRVDTYYGLDDFGKYAKEVYYDAVKNDEESKPLTLQEMTKELDVFYQIG